MRVGIGHEKQCAMGWLTQRTFRESGLQTEVMKNVVVQTPTGDMLVNQMRSRFARCGCGLFEQRGRIGRVFWTRFAFRGFRVR